MSSRDEAYDVAWQALPRGEQGGGLVWEPLSCIGGDLLETEIGDSGLRTSFYQFQCETCVRGSAGTGRAVDEVTVYKKSGDVSRRAVSTEEALC
ncbi:MAG: hypothetical protein WEB04_02715 [Dehalococcoidia bacterium]